MAKVPKAVGKSAIWKNIFSERSVREGSTEDLLSKVPAFGSLTTRELKEVAAIVHKRQYRTGEPVFYQGDPGLGMYMIQEGEVSIALGSKDALEEELAVLTEGDFFGEIALMDESPRTANAICKSDCTLIGFFRPDLFELIEKKPRLGTKIVIKLAEIIAQRLRKTDKELSKIKSQLDRLEAEQKEHNAKEEKSV
jgi:CRP-like cAMP-binding protein